MKKENYVFSGHNHDLLSAISWIPDGQPSAILQIAHGMTEHIERYEKLAQQLTAQGVVVAGFDFRGHGRNPGDVHIASFGEGGWARTLEDMHIFYEEMDCRYPGVPHFMLGFSLGSFLLREYLSRYDDGIAGAIIMGTGHQPTAVLSIMCALVKTQIRKSGFDGSTSLVQKLSFETYNQKFKPNRTPSDWLCSDAEQLDQYIRDPLCREQISSGLFYDLLCAMKCTGRKEACKSWRKDLPVLLLSGADDPVGDFGKGIRRVESALRRAGMQNVRKKLFSGARHDLLHEEAGKNAAEARGMIADWMAEVVQDICN